MLLERLKRQHTRRAVHYQSTGEIPVWLPSANRPTASGTDSPHSRAKPRGKLDKLLLAVEGTAVIGLIIVLALGLKALRGLNQEFTAALQQPTAAPTPLISAVVLPDGHTPPNSAGGAQPNNAEIPPHLLPIVQSLANIPIPTSSPEQALRVQIPAIQVDAPVVQGDGWEQLRKGVGQHINSGLPGQAGNLVLSAHNDVFGEIFRHLDQLKPGDEIIVYTASRQFSYTVTGSEIVEPTRVDVMANTPDPTLTLISCYPYLVDNKRIIIKAIIHY
jgi:sortase A